VLQYHFNWQLVSAMAGVTWWNFYFRLFPGTIRSPQVEEFLSHLLRHVPGQLLVIWDRATTHRSRLARDFVDRQNGRLTLEFLPGAPASELSGAVQEDFHEADHPCVRDFDSWKLGRSDGDGQGQTVVSLHPRLGVAVLELGLLEKHPVLFPLGQVRFNLFPGAGEQLDAISRNAASA
jgi:hypothetical protein